MKKILFLIVGIFLINSINAGVIYSGECLPVDLSDMDNLDNLRYTVVGNSSNLEGITIELNGTTADICTAVNYLSDSFTIILFNEKVVTNTVTVNTGGGGSSSAGTKVEYRDKIVPHYITETVEVDVPGENTVEIQTEETIITKMPFWAKWIIITLIIIIILVIIREVMISMPSKKEVTGGK